MIWEKFGRRTILSDEWYNKRHQRIVKCKCECWTEKIVQFSNIKNWKSKSCWCYRDEKMWDCFRTHWKTWTPIHKTWLRMRQRCYDKNTPRYKDWWWRWIIIEWDSFEEFYRDMFPTYKDWLTIERKDNDRNYYLENCKRATQKEQSNNKRNNHLLEYNWEIKTVSQWARQFNIPPSRVFMRLRCWWNAKDSLEKPPKSGKNKLVW